jgi:glycosyltransferase involved in cell wall biosynthesis
MFSKKFKKFEIIVVCNACKDRTYEKASSIKKKLPLVVLNTPERGKGNAVVLGLEQAKYDIIGFLDADNPYSLDEITKMLDHLEESDMVIVTKFNRPLKYQTSLTRRFFSLAGTFVFFSLFGMKFKDTQAGAKFMKKDLWIKLKKPFLCKGFEFDMELLYKATKRGAKIKEYYIKPNRTDFSTVKARILPGIMYRLIKMRLLQ